MVIFAQKTSRIWQAVLVGYGVVVGGGVYLAAFAASGRIARRWAAPASTS